MEEKLLAGVLGGWVGGMFNYYYSACRTFLSFLFVCVSFLSFLFMGKNPDPCFCLPASEAEKNRDTRGW